ncbi:hypothetical protein ACFVVM_07885 [Nocardia sp. NPDC058176]|uniref:hypothetical protein n=1 Tax=Nocardia sp. NPDC058176 TaxID=3346368 RepID=UPI0036DD3096
MAVLSRLIGSLAVVLGMAVVIPILAALAYAAIGHPECATIPQDVGPCGYWPRVAEYGPFIVLWGTVIAGTCAVVVWLGAVGVVACTSRRSPSSTDDS